MMENESISDCLKRIELEGYQPVRRVEKPIFKEEKGQKIPVGREIIFDTITPKSEH